MFLNENICWKYVYMLQTMLDLLLIKWCLKILSHCLNPVKEALFKPLLLITAVVKFARPTLDWGFGLPKNAESCFRGENYQTHSSTFNKPYI